MAKTTKKRNPNDATLRNVRAMRKELDLLRKQLVALRAKVAALYRPSRFALFDRR